MFAEVMYNGWLVNDGFVKFNQIELEWKQYAITTCNLQAFQQDGVSIVDG